MKKFLAPAVLTISAVLINYFGSILVSIIVFPLYLDSLLTIAVTACCGLVPGLLCAVFSNILLTVFSSASIWFVICHLLTALIAWYVFHLYKRKNPNKEYTIDLFLWVGLFAAIVNGILGNIIVSIVLSSIASRPQVNAVVQGIYVVVHNLQLATHLGGIIENLVDKILSALISFCVFRWYKRIIVTTHHKKFIIIKSHGFEFANANSIFK